MGGAPCWSRGGVLGVLPLSSHAAGGEDVDKFYSEIEPRKMRGVGGKFLKTVLFLTILLCCDWFSSISFAHNSNW